MSRLRTWAMRRAMGRLRIDDDIVRHLSTFQRLGETFEVESPGRAAADRRPHRVPRAADACRRADRPRLGVAVLARGPARPDGTGVHASRSSAVPHERDRPQLDARRQRRVAVGGDRRSSRSRHDLVRRLVARLVDRRRGRLARAVPRSTVARPAASHRRVAGGRDVDARAGRSRRAPRVRVLRGSAGDDESEMVIVEIENRSPVPFAVALAVRPYNPEGLAVIERIGLHDGTTVTVDGRVAMLLPTAAGAGRGVDVPRRRQRADRARRAARVPARSRRGFATRRGWRRPRSSIRCRTPRRCASRCRSYRPAARGAGAGRGVASSGRRRSRPRSRRPSRWPAAGPRRAAGACASCCPTRGCRRRSTPTAGSCSRCTTARTSRPGPSHVSPVLVPRRRVPARRARPVRLHVAGRRGASLVPRPAARRRVLLQPAQRVGLQRLRAVVDRRALAAHARPRVGRADARIRREGRAVDRPQAANEAPPRTRAARAAARGHLGRASRPFDYFYWDDFWCAAGLRSASELLAAFGQPEAADARATARRTRCGRTRSRRSAWSRAGSAPRSSPPVHAGGSTPASSDRWSRASRCTCWLPTIAASPPPSRSYGPVQPRRRLLPGDQPHWPRDVPHDAGRRSRARERRPPRPRPAVVAARRGDADVDVARGDPSPAPRRLHGRRPPRLGGRRLPVPRAQHPRAGGAGAPAWCYDARARAVLAVTGLVVGAGFRGARCADALRVAVVRGALARRPSRRCCGSSRPHDDVDDRAADRAGPRSRHGRRRSGRARRCWPVPERGALSG